MDSLNNEIARFKSENERARKTRVKYEDLLARLQKERDEFEKSKEIERQ